jgi:hypothetical protein
MGYKVKAEGFEGQDIEIIVSFWTGTKLLVNGEKAEKGPKRGQMLLKRNDGKEVIAILKQQLLGVDVPQIEIDGKLIELVKPLTWQQWLFAGSPVVVLLLGGTLGGAIAMIGVFLNVKLFRSEISDVLKYVLSIVVTALLIIGYLIFSVILLFLLKK